MSIFMKKSEQKTAVISALSEYFSMGYKLSDSALFAFHPSYTGSFWKELEKSAEINLMIKKAA